jgi:hypothetical protein
VARVAPSAGRRAPAALALIASAAACTSAPEGPAASPSAPAVAASPAATIATSAPTPPVATASAPGPSAAAEAGGLRATFRLGAAAFETSDGLWAEATLTNVGPRPLRVNTLVASIASLAVRVETPAGEPVAALLPPPVPRPESEADVLELAPGAARSFRYEHFLGVPLGAGAYRLRWSFVRTAAPTGQWSGRLEPAPLRFTIGKP